jgi:hypothetical protein
MQASKQACKADSPCVLEFPGLGVVPNVRTRLFVWTKQQQDKTDLRLSYVEQKTPGTKRVEALLFRIAPNPHCHRLLAPIPDASEEAACQQPELFPGDQESEKYLEELQTTFKLSSPRFEETPIGRGRPRDGISEGKGGRS